jgi:hypothetical protein
MRRLLHLLVCLVGALAHGQTKEAPKPPTAAPVATSTSLPFYSVDDATLVKFLVLERKAAQLDNQISSAQLEVEKAKQAKAEVWAQLTAAATQAAKDKGIDSTRYDFDATENRFIQKKKP